jgi:hypothetical protein
MSDHNRDRFREWCELLAEILADREMNDGEKTVMLRLALYKNLKTGLCNPGVKAIANGVAKKPRGTKYLLASLEARGRIKRDGGGRGAGDTTCYELRRVHSDAPLRVHGEDTRGQRAAKKDAKSGRVGCTSMPSNIENFEENTGTARLSSSNFSGEPGQPTRESRRGEVATDWKGSKDEFRKARKALKDSVARDQAGEGDGRQAPRLTAAARR